MPVGGSHRGIWKTSGGLSTSDTFNRANGALGSTDGGNILAWQAVKGTWSITSNRPTTSDARDTNPVAVVDAASPDVDVQMAVSSGGGDALYFRVVDANNWLRMRVDNTTYSYTYSYTCSYTYSYTCSYTQSYTCYATQYCTQYATFCNVWYASPCSCSAYHNHTGYTCFSTANSGCCPGSYSHSHSQTYGSCTCTASHSHSIYNENTRSTGSTVSCGSYSYTCYQTAYTTCYATGYQTCYATGYTNEPSTALEKNVAGTISSIATWPDNPTTLRAAMVGDQVSPFINGSAKAVQTVADHQTATKHGFGRGASPNNGTALDNFSLTAT